MRPHLTAWQNVPSFPSSVTCLFLFHQSIVDLQCCFNFCFTEKSFSCIHIYSFSSAFYYGLSQDVEYSSPCSTVGLYCLSILGTAAAAKSLQSCLTLRDPIDGSPRSSPIPGILQARTLEWVAISFSNAWKWKVKVKSLNCVRLFMTPWTAAHQAPPSMGFSRQEYWFASIHPKLLIHPSPPPFTLGNLKFVFYSVNLFLFYK